MLKPRPIGLQDNTQIQTLAPPPTRENIDRRRRSADEALQRAGDTSPIGHWTQGLARLADGAIGGLEARQADQMERQRQAFDSERAAGLVGAINGQSVQPSPAPIVPPGGLFGLGKRLFGW